MKLCKDCNHIKVMHNLEREGENHGFSKCKFGVNPETISMVSGIPIEPEYPYCSTERSSTDPTKCGNEGRHYERATIPT